MGLLFVEGAESEAPGWEPEELPLIDSIPRQPPSSRREEPEPDSEGRVVVVIDLA
jgi:hypothetical protein